MTSLPTERSGPLPRQPAVPVAVCFAAGIVLDRFALSWSWWGWGLAALVAVGVAVAGFRKSQARLVAASLLACGVCLGGLRHHTFWSLSTPNDVSRFVRQDSRLVRLRGRIAQPPFVKSPSQAPFQSAIPQRDVTILTLDCDSLQDRRGFVPITGKAQARVTGRRSDLRVGDLVEASGWISLPFPPANPGDFDFGDYLKRQGITCIVRVELPEAVTKLPDEDGPTWSRRIDEVRVSAEAVLHRHLSEQNAKIAAALLLGTRSMLDEEVRDAFTQTGMMHILALSGLHVGILAMLVFFVCRLLSLSPRLSVVLTFAAVLMLAVISGGRPPIIRATVFLGIVSIGNLAGRQSHPNNILALSAIVILAWNPTNLFDIGTQLSFLAVMGMLMTARWPVPWQQSAELAPDESQMENRWRKIASVIGTYLWRYLCLTLGIWLLTAPLIAAKFNLISPIGMLLNSFLVPLSVVVLWSGYLLLLFGSLLPVIAGAFAFPLEFGLTILLESVEWGSRVPLGHLEVSGPSNWWLAGYYLILAGIFVRHPQISRPRFAGAVLVFGWTALGLGIAAWPVSPPNLRATFLSVGHGSAILVEFPNGRTLLYDAGALDDGERAFRVIRTALWRRGISRLDAILLSHPDLDHVNAIPQLMGEVSVGTLLVAKSFFLSPQAVVPYLIERVKNEGIPLGTIGLEDRLMLDPSVAVEIQHPDPRKFYPHINANSLAVRLTYAGRSLLLVGDVEHEGLMDLMAHDPGQVDVLQAPHHGSRAANTPELVRWANPAIVVVSGGHVPGRMQELKALYGSSTRLLSTADDGAVMVEISADGHIQVKAHVGGD